MVTATATAVGEPSTVHSAPALAETVDVIPQRALPLPHLVLVEAFAAAGVFIAFAAHVAEWFGALAGVLLAFAFAIRVRRKTPFRWAILRTALAFGRRRPTKMPEVPKPLDHDLGGGVPMGYLWDGGTLVTLVRIDGDPHTLTTLEPGTLGAGDTVPVAFLAECLNQFDITLDSIDVISHGVRSRGDTHLATVYEAVLGPLPAIADRSVWVMIRFDPKKCPDAVRRRGSDWDGILRTSAVATRRVADQLSGRGLTARILSASEIGEATRQLSGGASIDELEEQWLDCRWGGTPVVCYALGPDSFTAARLGSLWTVSSRSTTVCVSLRQDEPSGPIMLRGLVRFDRSRRIGHSLTGIRRLPGQQRAALASTLPGGPPHPSVDAWVFARDAESLDQLALPSTGCGQVIGADDRGRAVAVSVFGPEVALVEICGGLALAQQVVLRALAVGARIRVHTDRASHWQTMAGQVADAGLLAIVDRSHGAVASRTSYVVEVFDGIPVHLVPADSTTIVVLSGNAEPTGNADVTLQLMDPAQDVVQLSTAKATVSLRMVATSDELRYLAS